MSGGGAHRTPPIRQFLRPSRYHCIFVVPLPIFPVLTSTSNRMESWSVAAPLRPARKTHEMASMVFSFDERPSRDAVITRNVDSGACSGSSEATNASFCITSCRIQSPPSSAFRKKWMPMPPSSFLCLMQSAGVSNTGETATPLLRPFSMKAHLFSMS